MGLFRPLRRQFWFWWRNRRRFAALERLCADPVLGKGVAISVTSGGVRVTVADGRVFGWKPRVMNSLLGIPYVGTFEPEETRLLSSLVRPSGTVLDIGANFGWYTTLFSKLVGPDGSVHAFEPVPPTFEELEGNVRLNGSPANVRLCRTALGERPGKLTMKVPTRIWLGPAFASSVVQLEGPHESFEVGMECLDDYLAKNGIARVDLVKCDVEGAELDVLKGARRLLSSPVPPIWFLEVQEYSTRAFGYAPADLFSLLGGFGYSFYHLADGMLREYPGTGRLPGYNFLCVVRGHHGDRIAPYLQK